MGARDGLMLIVGAAAIGVCGVWGAPRAQAAGSDTATVTATVTATAAASAPLAPATDVRIAPSSDGHVGAWLLSTTLAPLPDPQSSAPFGPSAASGGPQWHAAASDGAVDVAAALDLAKGKDRRAFAAGALHVEQGGRFYFLVAADDGVSLAVDGKDAYDRSDAARARFDDDDVVSLDLAAGDHVFVVRLHNRGGGDWKLSARVLDADLQPPRGAWWWLPGTGAGDARAAAASMATASLDRGLRADGYAPALTVRFPEGAPRGVKLAVRARLARTSGTGEPAFDVDAGEVVLDERGAVRDLVTALPLLPPDSVEDDDWTLHVDAAGRALDFPFHPRRAVREAIARADRALAAQHDDSVEHLRSRLAAFVDKGDADVDAQGADARELDDLAASLERKQDPWAARTGVMRRAYRSPADGKLSEFALYVPPDARSCAAGGCDDPAKRYPLVVALHGMNGHPMQMLMWLFGHDDPLHDGSWEDRHPRADLRTLEAIAIAPGGHFNTMYRDLGEDDVMRVVDWAMARYPIDEARVSITGPSMGGIGTAACALHHPDRFAAAEPLCGYHSYFVRGDIGGRAMRPWERSVAEERSNSFWAENGLYIPLYVVHGTKDLPEENSGVLIDRYEALRYYVKHEHPDLGHNVWQKTYEDLKGARWLTWHKRPLHPRAIRFKTTRTRWADDAWVHVREMAQSGAWGEVVARIDEGNVVRVSARGIADLALDRDTQRIDDAAPVTVRIGEQRSTFQAGEPIELHVEGGVWRPGPAHHEGAAKRGHVTGPIRDVLHEPILFVWGASDPSQSRANEDAARAWARVRPGVHVDYPVMSDADFVARGESVAGDRALFLVGNAKSNRIVRDLEPSFPIRIDGEDVVVGAARFSPKDGTRGASQLGVAFIRPNPRRPDRYVVVVEGAGPLGTWRSRSLPDMLPDWVVFDEDVAPARGQLLLGAGAVRAAGLFDNDWRLTSER